MGTVFLIAGGVFVLIFIGAFLAKGDAGEAAGQAAGCVAAPLMILFQLAMYGAGIILALMAGAWLLKTIGILG